ncbi:MAG: YicC/YloC family endoribonuclease [Smithellaceae bacterium]
MIKSMTGYGRVETTGQDRNIVVEIKSVNHRFLEISLRMPQSLFPLELEFKKKIGEKLKRGRVEIFIRLEPGSTNVPAAMINLEIARNYFAALQRLKEEFGLTEEIGLKTLVGFRDIFSQPAETEMDPDVLKQITAALEEALDMLVRMRQEEGVAIYQDMEQRLASISGILETINTRSPQVVIEYQRRLAERIKELTAGYDVLADSRLAQEAAILAEKSDITEEIVRMHSHIGQFVTLLQSVEAEGKKIDFLLQEMNREINTIGSKSNDAEIARQVIEAKSELSRLREQAQNIE